MNALRVHGAHACAVVVLLCLAAVRPLHAEAAVGFELAYMAVPPANAGGVLLGGAIIGPADAANLYGSVAVRGGLGWSNSKTVEFELIDTSDGYLGGGYRDERLPLRLGLAGDVSAMVNLAVPVGQTATIAVTVGPGLFYSYFPPLRDPPSPPGNITVQPPEGAQSLPTEKFSLSYPVVNFPHMLPLGRLRLELRFGRSGGIVLDIGANPAFGTVSVGLISSR